ncbi:MAG: hypothetical protein GX494_12730 [Clostridiaceae bacterium]|nr:hypothetical protein [Clostridiaceae bacterium]NLM27332.1 hypothetical protein [Clostridiaceae bacterium]
MKRIMTGIVIGIILSLAVPAFASAIFDRNKVINMTDTWKIYYNGEEVNMDDPKQDEDYQILGYNGRTYVPVRLIMELAGCDSELMWSDTNPTKIFLNNIEMEKLMQEKELYKEKAEQASKLYNDYASKFSANIDTSVGYILKFDNITLTIYTAENTIKYEKDGRVIGVYHAR